jgi:hypothetical protein
MPKVMTYFWYSELFGVQLDRHGGLETWLPCCARDALPERKHMENEPAPMNERKSEMSDAARMSMAMVGLNQPDNATDSESISPPAKAKEAKRSPDIANLPFVKEKLANAASPDEASRSNPAFRVTASRLIPPLVLAAAMLMIGLYAGRKTAHRNGLPPVATVNGEAISEGDLARAVDISAAKVGLQRAIDDKLIIQYASQHGMIPDQNAVNARYDQLAKAQDPRKRPSASMLTSDAFKRGLLVTMCREAMAKETGGPSDSDPKSFYLRNVDSNNPHARYYHHESVVVEIIATTSKADGDKAMADLKGGIPFEAAVRKYSVDKSRATNGVLPPLKRGSISEKLYPGAEHIVFDQMQTGDTVGPIQYGSIWWIWRCINHVTEHKDEFKAVEADCIEQAAQERLGFQDGKDLLSQRLENVATVTVLWPQLAGLPHKP